MRWWRVKTCWMSCDIGPSWPLPHPHPSPLLSRLAKNKFGNLAQMPLARGSMAISDIFRHERNWLIVYPKILFPTSQYHKPFSNPPWFDRLECWLLLNGNKIQLAPSPREPVKVSVRPGRNVCHYMANPSQIPEVLQFFNSCIGPKTW